MDQAALARPENPLFVIDLVPREAMRAVWPHVSRRLLNIAENSHGEMTLESIARRLADKHWQLWVVSEKTNIVGCVVTEVSLADSGLKMCTIRACVGEDATRWQHLLDEVEQWAQANGCQKINTWARKGWARRLPEYKLTHVMLEKVL